MEKKPTQKKAEKVVIMNIERPLILITSSEDEDANKLKKKTYEDEYRVIADLTGFDNLRAMMEAETIWKSKRKKKKKKKKRKGRNALSYPQEKPSENKKAERSGDILSGNTQQERENAIILISSSEDEVLVEAMKDVGESSRVQAEETAEELKAASTKLNMVRGEKQPVTNQGAETACLLEEELVGRNYEIMPRRPLRRPRYFDPPDNCWRPGSSRREECDTTVSHKPQWRKRPCFICASFDHTSRACNHGQNFYVWKAGSGSAKDCLAKQDEDNKRCNFCLRCGNLGHSMLLCKSAYSQDDLQKIQCYLCKSFGHLCCGSSQDLSPREPSCYSCGGSGHIGSECTKFC